MRRGSAWPSKPSSGIVLIQHAFFATADAQARVDQEWRRGQGGSAVSGLRDGGGGIETHPEQEQWPKVIHAQCLRKLGSSERIPEQKCRPQRGGRKANCDRMDRCATEPRLTLKDVQVGTCRLKLRKTLGRNGVPADMLAT